MESYYDRGKIKQRPIANLLAEELLALHVDWLVELWRKEPRKMTGNLEKESVEAYKFFCALRISSLEPWKLKKRTSKTPT
ncbi:hypothetical protein A7K93_10805 [Candidatus Methylacidiphilum fumarolicum]|uniref:Uncharacterized protein n=2 Tax=Candidatus Methylacidiphilum fumarolicum TaxID=591154 RepID=I0JYK9_METFB|nr:hypothetical protein [Candidatus Methylacidiphilum fumarolicum]CCG92328.1 hypothetical protein MFUM_630002 [Methylacidiphilum fumariolicum SolV]MBW6415498.1 hypothetical protein [Candidatus Methylacidiphilum fumarolicum]TFE66082.1 hypothetical protein A7K73_10715 [Candidatus Methylacidiphilum fumarolicum]TFE71360.1 hypothetical protein A7K72_11090 [Candidatus Methylacidiphilum fumarolicum]TFE71456.1 hypothetical protein A7K93_10805 [Candidatus Methylacidiphilum fumarolicum]